MEKSETIKIDDTLDDSIKEESKTLNLTTTKNLDDKKRSFEFWKRINPGFDASMAIPKTEMKEKFVHDALYGKLSSDDLKTVFGESSLNNVSLKSPDKRFFKRMDKEKAHFEASCALKVSLMDFSKNAAPAKK